MPKLNLKETVARIDFLGLFLGTAAVVLLLIPTSEGGHAGTPWVRISHFLQRDRGKEAGQKVYHVLILR